MCVCGGGGGGGGGWGNGFPIKRTSLRPYFHFCSFTPGAGVSNICKEKSVPLLVKKQRLDVQIVFFQSETPTSHIYLGRAGVRSMCCGHTCSTACYSSFSNTI